MRSLRTHATTFAIAAVTATAIAAIPALARDAGAHPPKPPVVKTGEKDGPIDVPNDPQPVAKMSLPAGKYTIFAKAYVASTSPTDGNVTCTLQAGTDQDQSLASVAANDADRFGNAPMALNVSHVFPSTAAVELVCSDNDTAMAIDFVRITAIRAGTLTSKQLA